jgi:hypothetical protein
MERNVLQTLSPFEFAYSFRRLARAAIRSITRMIGLLSLLLLLPAVVLSQDFSYTVNNGSVTITGYTGPGGAVVIPDTITSLPVTTIGGNAFVYQTNLTSVTIPTGVTSIEGYAFAYCTNLVSVTIPDSVTSIGPFAFSHCTSLTSVTIPNSVTSIGGSAFHSCTSLTSILVEAGNPNYSSVDGVLFDKVQTSLIQCPEGKAGGYTIPTGVTSVRYAAFSSCSSLMSVTIPKSVTSIGVHAFGDCTSLTSIEVDAANPNYSSADGVLFNKAQTTLIQYPGGKGGGYTIPNSVTTIGESAFAYCASLTSVTIPNGVTIIGAYAFYSCISLTSVAIPNSVARIEHGAFASCTNLTNMTVPTGVTIIGNSAFAYCTSLINVSIPPSVTIIGSLAFSYCTSLTSMTVPPSVTIIGYAAFFECTSLMSVTIPNSVTSIGERAFYNCTSLTSVTIPNSVTSIESFTFFSCTSLTTVLIPNSITRIGDHVFSYCASLTSATIPNSVTSIGNGAFSYCTGLTSITIPISVSSIGDLVFHNCTSLISVYFAGNAPTTVGFEVFLDTSATVYYLPVTTGWGPTFAGRPTVLWNPAPQIIGPTDPFGFTITGSSNLVIVVEAATSLSHPDWTPVSTNTLTDGSSPFSDPQWMNHPARYYRLRSP